MLGPAACTTSAPHEATGTTHAAGVEPSIADSAGAGLSSAFSAAPSRPAQSSPTQVATGAAKGTKTPTAGAPHTTAAATGVRVTSIKMLEFRGWAALCDPTVTVSLLPLLTFSASERYSRTTIQVRSSDGHDPEPQPLSSCQSSGIHAFRA
jgi:hypothetical protein